MRSLLSLPLLHPGSMDDLINQVVAAAPPPPPPPPFRRPGVVGSPLRRRLPLEDRQGRTFPATSMSPPPQSPLSPSPPPPPCPRHHQPAVPTPAATSIPATNKPTTSIPATAKPASPPPASPPPASGEAGAGDASHARHDYPHDHASAAARGGPGRLPHEGRGGGQHELLLGRRAQRSSHIYPVPGAQGLPALRPPYLPLSPPSLPRTRRPRAASSTARPAPARRCSRAPSQTTSTPPSSRSSRRRLSTSASASRRG